MAKFKLATADVEALFALIYELKDMRVERRNEAAARRMVHEAQRKKSMKREQPDRSGEQSSNGLSAYPSGRRDLGVQVAALSKALHIWITTGEPPPPTSPTFIQLILIAAGADALEKAFLAAFCYHFGADYAERDGVLVDRARELAVYPLPMAATPREPTAVEPPLQKPQVLLEDVSFDEDDDVASPLEANEPYISDPPLPAEEIAPLDAVDIDEAPGHAAAPRRNEAIGRGRKRDVSSWPSVPPAPEARLSRKAKELLLPLSVARIHRETSRGHDSQLTRLRRARSRAR